MPTSSSRQTAPLPDFIPRRDAAPSIWKSLGLPERGRALQAAVAAGVPYRVFVRLARVTGLGEQELREVAGIARSTLQRREKEKRFNAAESDRLYRVAEVWEAALMLWNGDVGAAHAWLTQPVKGLGGERPVDLLQTTLGTQQVLDLIGRLEHGVVG